VGTPEWKSHPCGGLFIEPGKPRENRFSVNFSRAVRLRMIPLINTHGFFVSSCRAEHGSILLMFHNTSCNGAITAKPRFLPMKDCRFYLNHLREASLKPSHAGLAGAVPDSWALH
jgi:hypothetical protein